MTSIFFNSPLDDEKRRNLLYSGDIFVYSTIPVAQAFVEFAREMIEAAFAPLDPQVAQHELPVEEFAAILAKLKPAFIHHPKSKAFVGQMLTELGCDPTKTYFDVPRMRTSTSHSYLTSGISYAFHPHRDTWYSAAPCQLNWWFPIYDVEPDNVMAFHPHYWSQGVKNSSSCYNYYQWNATSRQTAAQHVKQDTRVQPKPQEEMELDPQIRIVSKPGDVMVFSAAQMHSTVQNTSGKTRFSIDFRTVHYEDVVAKRGALNVDSECTGTALRDFLRITDLERIPEQAASLYDIETLSEGLLIYEPSTVVSAG
ncbi:hypothetical protein H6F89_08160 [Cyanobacteria bacterium FACHB-63]|nr:hypothetical protein [Cyanobacteria bacterium FACHB-63]